MSKKPDNPGFGCGVILMLGVMLGFCEYVIRGGGDGGKPEPEARAAYQSPAEREVKDAARGVLDTRQQIEAARREVDAWELRVARRDTEHRRAALERARETLRGAEAAYQRARRADAEAVLQVALEALVDKAGDAAEMQLWAEFRQAQEAAMAARPVWDWAAMDAASDTLSEGLPFVGASAEVKARELWLEYVNAWELGDTDRVQDAETALAELTGEAGLVRRAVTAWEALPEPRGAAEMEKLLGKAPEPVSDAERRALLERIKAETAE